MLTTRAMKTISQTARLSNRGGDQEAAAAFDTVRQMFFRNPDPYLGNRGGYLTLNFVPSIATMLLGVLCGGLLMGGDGRFRKLVTLVLAGAICLGLGILAHHTVCPVVKRIWTPSWVLFSGGYVIWGLAISYLLFDILPLRLLAFPLVVVGMNSLAMYLMGQTLRPWVGHAVVQTHLTGVLEVALGPELLADDMFGRVIGPTSVFVIFWLIALWMYRNRFFVKV